MRFRCKVRLAFCCLLLAHFGPLVVTQASDLQREGNLSLRFGQEPPVYGYTLVEAFSGLSFENPIGLASAPGETNRLFVLEQVGLVYVITNLSSPTRTLFLDVRPIFNGCEGGLLGLAFH